MKGISSVSMQRGTSSRGGMDVRVHVDGLFSYRSDMYRVGMASRAIVGLVEVHFVFRVLI